MPSHCNENNCACDCRMSGEEFEKYEIEIDKLKEQISEMQDENEELCDLLKNRELSKKDIIKTIIMSLNKMEV